MPKSNIEVKVKEKLLEVDGRKLCLEENFEGAGTLIVRNKKDESILELYYRKYGDFSKQYNEASKIRGFLEALKVDFKEIYACTPLNYEGDVFPAVRITGNFNATIYNTQSEKKEDFDE